MPRLSLQFITGDLAIDQSLKMIVSHFETTFPDRIRGYYLVGSYARQDAIETSDIDLVMVFKQRMTEEEKQRAQLLHAQLARSAPCVLDLHPASEHLLLTQGAVRLQQASQLLFGEDIRPAVPLKALDDHIRDMMHQTYHCLRQVRRPPAQLQFPLDAPDPADPYLGYAQRTARAAGKTYTSTKDLISNAFMIAISMLFATTQRYVGDGSKQATVGAYQQYIGDTWGDFLEAVYSLCRQRWHYRIPTSQAEQEQLRQLAHTQVAFDNHFLTRYKDYLLTEAHTAPRVAKLFAIQRLGQVIFPDGSVAEALRRVDIRGDEALDQAVTETLKRYNTASGELKSH